MANLDELVATFAAALDNLSSQPADDPALNVLSVMLARDHVAEALLRNHSFPPSTLMRIGDLDCQLKARMPAIESLIGGSTFVQCRTAVQPPANAWWWFPDEPQPSPLWGILSVLFILTSASLASEIAARFLAPGADFIGVFVILSQLLVVVLSALPFTQPGVRELERLLSRFGVERKVHHAWKTGLAFAVLLLILVLRMSFPAIARSYNDQGVREQQGGRVTSAIESFERAISLSPDYAQAHYNLATAYEDVLNYDKASGEYQAAIRADPQLLLSYNNLARLYLLQHRDYAKALTLLDTALEHKIDLPDSQRMLVQYSLLKNRGWAHLGLNNVALAEADLKQALALRDDGAAAHCLLAQVLEAQSNSKTALAEWESCLRYQKGDVVESNWLALARERLSQGRPK